MASPRHTQPARLLTVLLLSLAATLSVLPAGVSQAEKRPSLAQVEQRIDALNVKIATVNEDYGGSRLELSTASRRAALAKGRVRATEAELGSLRRSMDAVAAAAYKAGGTDQFVQLISTSTPQTFLDRASSLNRIAAGQNAQLAAASTTRHRLATVQREAARALAVQRGVAAKMAKQKALIEDALAQQEQLLRSLKADERRKLLARRAAEAAAAAAEAQAAAKAAAAEAAAQAAAQAAAARGPRVTRSRGVARPTYNGPASGRAAIAVREAYRQLGKPYQWAAAGPDRFDCSGLTMWVWGKAGVSLPHQSRAQYAGGRKVSQSDLQPGDLTFYGSPIHHVGVYVGGGRMISAPQTGDVVKLQNALRSDYVGAVRP